MNQQPVEQKPKWWLWLVLAVIAIGAGIGLYLWLSGGGLPIIGSSVPQPPAFPD